MRGKGVSYGAVSVMNAIPCGIGSTIGIDLRTEATICDSDEQEILTIDRPEGDVDLADCEHVHRAVLAAFDRDVEDYALTVGSAGISGAEADAMLKEMDNE